MYTIFVGHPFDLAPWRITDYRAAFTTAFDGVANVTYADDKISDEHILIKIRQQIETADLCLFDLTGGNPNVSLELGISIGLSRPYRLLLKVGTDVITDLAGWDRLEYKSLQTLTNRLFQQVAPILTNIQPRHAKHGPLDTGILPFINIEYAIVNDSIISGHITNIGSGAAIHTRVKLPGFGDICVGEPILVNASVPFKLFIRDMKFSTPPDLIAEATFMDKAGTRYRQRSRVYYPYHKGEFMDYILDSFDPPVAVG